MIQKTIYRLSQWRIRKLREKISAERSGDGALSWRGRKLDLRLQDRLRTSRRYWSLAMHGGGVVGMGLLTEAEARDKVLKLGYEITAVNTNGAFVAVRQQRDRAADAAE